MNAQQKAPLPGYGDVFGTKKSMVAEVAGPTLYATGGQTITARDFGWGGFDYVSVSGLSYSGTYFCRVQYLPVDAAPSAQNPSVYQVNVLWYVLSTGNEAGAIDLSAEVIRLFALGL